jgi:hypothetical protein
MKLIPMLKKHNKRLMGWEDYDKRHVQRRNYPCGGGNEGVTPGGAPLQLQRMATIQFCLMGIILI